MKLRKILGFVAKVGHPLLRILGVKKGTVADKVSEAAEVIDKNLPPSK